MARPKLQDQPPDLDDASDDAAPEILRAPEPPAAPDTPMPFAPALEKATIPQVEDVVAGLRELAAY